MDMQIFGLLVQDGLASGAVYVLLALALVMVFTVTRIVFVPQGEFVSASVLTIAAFQQGQAPGLAVPVAAVALLACGMETAERLRRAASRGWAAGSRCSARCRWRPAPSPGSASMRARRPGCRRPRRWRWSRRWGR